MDSEKIPDSFICCVCWDLLYKPVVLHCGHVACFWCVHLSMSYRDESHCPICRNPYSHFPAICQMLHFLLLKLYPITYKKREQQILEEEKESGKFSPELNSQESESHGDGEFNYHRSSGSSSALCFQPRTYSDSQSTRNDELCNTAGQVESHDNGTTHAKINCDGDLDQIKPVSSQVKEKVSVMDLLCTACKLLLFRPVVLNCGHVYCQTCIIIPADERLRCQVCQCLHPRGSPRVCLALDQFLADKFSKEYALRRDAVQLEQASSKHERDAVQLEQASSKHERAITGSGEAGEHDHLPSTVLPHSGVGCDACGMYPIVGDRYRCKDCTELAGFDLCGDCYNNQPKVAGRFNQQHSPEHKFELIKPKMTPRLFILD